MSARPPICLPAHCATICCSACATARSGRPNTRPTAPNAARPQLYEARRSGNIDLDLHADWVDYEAAGVADARGLVDDASPRCWRRLDFEEDVYTLGLRWRLDPEANPEAAARLLEARKALARRLVEDGITNLVETYDPERFNFNASVAENLLFGTPIGPAFDFEALADNTYVSAGARQRSG